MKTINLRTYYYPHYTEDVFVEVSDEVAEVMLLSVREMENYRRRTCRPETPCVASCFRPTSFTKSCYTYLAE